MDRSTLSVPMLAQPGAPAVEWTTTVGLVEYADAVLGMEQHVTEIEAGRANECVWLLEHPPIYTAGTSARDEDVTLTRFPVHHTGRGGQYTYHGPGQRIAYVMLDLKRRKPDVRAFVSALEGWVIDALARCGVMGERREDRVGVWVSRPDGRGEDKIAALGIRVRHWISFHGVSINVSPDLSHYSGIVPCGIADPRYGITSLAQLGKAADLAGFDEALRAAFEHTFGMTVNAEPPRLGTLVRMRD